MHEAIITRGNIQSIKFEDQIQIMTRYNTVLIHEGECHHKAQHTKVGLYQCINQIIFYEGIANVRAWLQFMEPLIHRSLYTESMYHINEAVELEKRAKNNFMWKDL